MLLFKRKIGLAILDILIIAASFIIGFWYVFDSGLYYEETFPYPVYYIPSISLLTIIFPFVFQLEGLYKYQALTNPFQQVLALIRCYIRVLALFIILVFFLKTQYIADSRLTIGLGFLISFILMLFIRVLFIPKLFYYLVKTGRIRKRVLIVGAGRHGQMVFKHLNNNPKSYFDIVGFCDDDPKKIGSSICGKEVFGSSEELKSVITKFRIQEIIIAISNIKKGELLDLIEKCKRVGLIIHVISDLLNEVNEKMDAEDIELMTYRVIPNVPNIAFLAIKRLFDIVLTIIIMIAFFPLFLIIAWAIKRDSKGPIFYRSNVIGKEGKPFVAYKFRTMISNTVNSKENQKHVEGKKRHSQFMKDFIQGNISSEYYVKDDVRITKVGRFLRKYSLDELPQLINVLKGDISLVGPRFCTVEEYKFYKPWHKRRFQIKPGMTGLWQVRARSEVVYDDMVMIDLYYVQNMSIIFDIEIILRTISVVLSGKGSKVGILK